MKNYLTDIFSLNCTDNNNSTSRKLLSQQRLFEKKIYTTLKMFQIFLSTMLATHTKAYLGCGERGQLATSRKCIGCANLSFLREDMEFLALDVEMVALFS